MRQLVPDLQELPGIRPARPEKGRQQLPWRRLPAQEAELATTTVIFGIPNVLPGGVSRVGNNEYGEIGRRTRLILRGEHLASGLKITAVKNWALFEH